MTLLAPRAPTSAAVETQAGGGAGAAARPPSRAQQRRRPAPGRDYSRFSHATEAHLKRKCADCHTVASFERPDVTDYPDHPSCVECHRQQFFRGAWPAICSNCHVVTSPRGEARLRFPKPGAPSQFADVFPHASHVKTTSLIQFRKVVGEKANTQTTCLYCHKPDRAQLKPAAGAPADAFVPPPGTFMTTPTSHATCFQCHWREGVDGKDQPPLANECARCHQGVTSPAAALAAAPPAVRPAAGAVQTPAAQRPVSRPTPALLPAVTAAFVLASSPGGAAAVPPRVSPKFVHEIDAHRKRQNDEGKEVQITCLQCHVAVRKAATLESLRAKEGRVQLPTCSSSACHTAVSGTAQLKLSVYRELRERGRDAKFDCALCHAPPVSLAAEVPCDHYAAVFAAATKEKKSTRGVEQLTPPRCAEATKGEVK